MLISQASFAQTPSASVWDDPTVLFSVTVGFMFVVAILVLAVCVYLLKVVNTLAEQAAIEKAKRAGKEYQPEPSMLSKFWDTINGFVPKEKEATLVLEHDYDGIKELDNHLPPWWKWLFYATIVWGAVYLVMYHIVNTLPLSTAEYNNEVAYANEQMQKLRAANPEPPIDEATVEATTDVAALADGKSTFLNTCASCHRRDGGGDIGPNLTDQYWKHGGDIKNIFKVVKNGVPNTNMVAWGGVMSPSAIRNVASYVLTLQGSNPQNPKKPEGDLFKPQVEPVKADTTKASP